MSIAPNSVVADRFVIEARAGAGGMGTVYRATDRETGWPVAIKVLDASGMNAASAQRFARETRLLGVLDHPGIVRYVAHGEIDDGRPFLAMEWLDGEDLAAHLARDRGGEPIPIDDVLAIARGTAAALAAGHARGVIHRDVKPSNLLLVDGNPRLVKILDFGIAREAAAHAATESRLGATSRPVTRTGAIVGTVGYMAPEQARGDRSVDARADVFSLGCVLFECLTGRPAFVGSHVVAVLAKILLEDAPRASTLRSGVPPELDDLLVRMLAKDAHVRPPDAQAVHRALETMTTTTPSSRARAPFEARPALANREQRLVTIVLAKTGDIAAASVQIAIFGGDVHPLADGTMLLVAFMAGEPRESQASSSSNRAAWGLATDQVARAASCALELAPHVDAVAIATGRVETTGDGRMGPIVDRVVRMLRGGGPRTDEDAAAPRSPQGILIDAISAGLLEGRFDVRAVAPTPAGGSADDHDGDALYFLHGITRDRIAPRTLLGRVTPCVGRSKELALLEATFRECADEPIARLCLVTGPPGVGKSRLCYELFARLAPLESKTVDVGVLSARRLEPRILLARGDPVGAGAALALVRELIRAAAMRSSGRENAEPAPVSQDNDANDDSADADADTSVVLRASLEDHLREIFPEPAQTAMRERVCDMLGELLALPASSAPGPELRAARNNPSIMGGALRRAFEEWLAALARRSPTLLVLEDMHWGDVASVSFIEDALRAHPNLPIMVLGLARPEVHELFPRFRSSSATDANDNVQEIRLPALTKSAAEQLVRAVLREAPPETVGRIIARADGNAFYLEELVRHVVERSDQSMPATVLAVAQSRIESLDAEARRVLRVASVFGDVFPVAGVSTLLSSKATGAESGDREPDASLARIVRELVHRELLVARASATASESSSSTSSTTRSGTLDAMSFAFRHGLLREAAYAMLTDEESRGGSSSRRNVSREQWRGRYERERTIAARPG